MASPPEHMQAAGAAAVVDAFALPKRGHTTDEYEDAYAVSDVDAFPLHAAVADGATESAFARRWAQLLVRGWVEDAPGSPQAFVRALPGWQRTWQHAVAASAQEKPWYAAAKAEEGAFAACLGLTLQPNEHWQALSVGDCVMLQLRGGQRQTAWPLSEPAAFTHRPTLVSSRAPADAVVPAATQGTWRPGDVFLLASDALAAWLLKAGPARARSWDALAFARGVQSARDDGVLHNDDVTLVRIVLRPA